MINKNIFFSALLIFSVISMLAESIVIKNATIYNGLDDNPFTGNILIEDGLINPRLRERLAMAMRLAFRLSSRPISAEPVTIADPTP